MNRSLYEINEDYLAVINGSFTVDEETGEILFDETKLNELNSEFENKVDNTACFIKDRSALIEARKNEIKALQEKNKEDEKKIEYLKDFILTSLLIRDMKKLETPRNTVSYRLSKSVNVLNEALVPLEFLKEKITTSVDKKAIMEKLKKNEAVAGCVLQENKNISIK